MFKLNVVLFCFISVVLNYSAYADDVKANNSSVNQRDQSTSEVTAQDQGSSDQDISLTRKIRQEIVHKHAFSTDAKNIKIITNNGLVTLKGPVKSADEKMKIERIAMHIAGKNKVTSQIDVVQE